jgi:hypothetical protein
MTVRAMIHEPYMNFLQHIQISLSVEKKGGKFILFVKIFLFIFQLQSAAVREKRKGFR